MSIHRISIFCLREYLLNVLAADVCSNENAVEVEVIVNLIRDTKKRRDSERMIEIKTGKMLCVVNRILNFLTKNENYPCYKSLKSVNTESVEYPFSGQGDCHLPSVEEINSLIIGIKIEIQTQEQDYSESRKKRRKSFGKWVKLPRKKIETNELLRKTTETLRCHLLAWKEFLRNSLDHSIHVTEMEEKLKKLSKSLGEEKLVGIYTQYYDFLRNGIDLHCRCLEHLEKKFGVADIQLPRSTKLRLSNPFTNKTVFGNEAIWKSCHLERELRCYRLSLIASQEALRRFEEGNLLALDANGKDNACQVRTSKTLDLCVRKESIMKEFSHIFSERTEKIIRKLGYLCDSEKPPVLLDCPDLLTFLFLNDLFVPVYGDLRYLSSLYLRSDSERKAKELVLEVLTPTLALDFYYRYGGVEERLVKYLMAISHEYLVEEHEIFSGMMRQMLSMGGMKDDHQYGKDVNVEQICDEIKSALFQVKGSDGKYSAPNLVGMMVTVHAEVRKMRKISVTCWRYCRGRRWLLQKVYAFSHAKGYTIDEGINTAAMMNIEGWSFNGSFTDFAKEVIGDTKGGIGDECDFGGNMYGKISSGAESVEVMEAPCTCSECRSFEEEFLQSDFLMDIVFPNEAQHKQFPGKKKQEIDFTDLKICEEYFRCFLEKSKNGMGRSNMNVFLIHHIYPFYLKN